MTAWTSADVLVIKSLLPMHSSLLGALSVQFVYLKQKFTQKGKSVIILHIHPNGFIFSVKMHKQMHKYVKSA